MRFFLFRHGETDWNAEERFQGHHDVPLNDRGREQARQLVPVLRQARIEVVVSSNLSRALETARVVAEGLGVPLLVDARLREAHLGDAQGMTRAQIEARFGQELLTRWRSTRVSDADVSYPGGETGRQVLERARAALEDLAHGNDFRSVGVATHGGVIRRIARSLVPPESPPVPIPNGVVYELHVDTNTGSWSFLA